MNSDAATDIVRRTLSFKGGIGESETGVVEGVVVQGPSSCIVYWEGKGEDGVTVGWVFEL